MPVSILLIPSFCRKNRFFSITFSSRDNSQKSAFCTNFLLDFRSCLHLILQFLDLFDPSFLPNLRSRWVYFSLLAGPNHGSARGHHSWCWKTDPFPCFCVVWWIQMLAKWPPPGHRTMVHLEGLKCDMKKANVTKVSSCSGWIQVSRSTSLHGPVRPSQCGWVFMGPAGPMLCSSQASGGPFWVSWRSRSRGYKRDILSTFMSELRQQSEWINLLDVRNWRKLQHTTVLSGWRDFCMLCLTKDSYLYDSAHKLWWFSTWIVKCLMIPRTNLGEWSCKFSIS